MCLYYHLLLFCCFKYIYSISSPITFLQIVSNFSYSNVTTNTSPNIFSSICSCKMHYCTFCSKVSAIAYNNYIWDCASMENIPYISIIQANHSYFYVQHSGQCSNYVLVCPYCSLIHSFHIRVVRYTMFCQVFFYYREEEHYF